MNKLWMIGLSAAIVLTGCNKDDEDSGDSGETYTCSTFNGDKQPSIGDEVKLYEDSTSITSTLSGGKGITWDFSGLVKQDSTEIDFTDPAAATNGGDFPTANLAANIGSELVFLKKHSTGVEVLGVEADVSGVVLAMEFSDKYNLYNFPLEYGEEISDDFHIEDRKYNLTFDLAGTIYSADSVDVKRTGKLVSKVDGCGKIKTPTKEYEVLRVYKEEHVADTVTAYVFFGIGTTPIKVVQTDVINRSYEFVTDSLKFPVATVTLNANKEATRIQFVEE